MAASATPPIRLPHSAIPVSDIPSIAISLPRKIASTGTAAASTSITLFDFSSTTFDSNMPASIRVSRNRMNCPPRAITWRAAEELPPAGSTIVVAIATDGRSIRPVASRSPSATSSSRNCTLGDRRSIWRAGPISVGALGQPVSTTLALLLVAVNSSRAWTSGVPDGTSIRRSGMPPTRSSSRS